MAPFFKFKNRLLSFMAFVLTPFASVPTPINTIPRTTTALPPIDKENEIPITTWVLNVDALLAGRSLDSIAAWAELSNFRLKNAYHYKMKEMSRGEHEYVVCEFSYPGESPSSIFLQFDRSASHHRSNTAVSTSTFSLSETDTSIIPEGPNSNATPPQTVVSEAARVPSSRSSFSLKKVFRGSSAPVSRTKSDSSLSLSRPVAISSNRYLAHDTVYRLKALPSDTMGKSITFSHDDLARCPCLWDVMILTSTVHKEKIEYKLLGDQQCYWFADTIFYILEKWAENHKNGEINYNQDARLGYFIVTRIYERPSGDLSIWNTFLDDKRDKELQREQSEQANENEERRKQEEWERPLKQEVTALKQRNAVQEEQIVDQEQQIADLQHAQEEMKRTADQERQTSATQKQYIADLQRTQEEMKRQMDAMMEMFTARQGTN